MISALLVQGVVELEDGIRHFLDGAERVRILVVEFHCRSGYDGRVAFNLVEEVGEFPGDFRLVRESSLHDNVRTGFPEWQPCRPATKVRDRMSVKAMRDHASEPNLVVVLFDRQLIDEIPASQRIAPVRSAFSGSR